jgi:hypothetical protein
MESLQPPAGSSSSASTTAVTHRFNANEQSASPLCIFSGAALYEQTWNFQLYAGIVNEYTGRSLTYKNDVIHAFTAIKRTLERSSGMTFIHPMPEKDLLRSLVWSSCGGSGAEWCRRREWPSWAWAGWRLCCLYYCWESDRSIGEKAHSEHRGADPLGMVMSKVKRTVTMCSESKFPAVFAHVGNYESSERGYCSHKSHRLRCATVSIHSSSVNPTKSRLLLISETRSVLLHRNAPQLGTWTRPISSEDDLLHPVTRQIKAGHNYLQNDYETWKLLAFNLNVDRKCGECITAHTAVPLYEWKIRGKIRRWHQRVVMMLVDRLADGTVQRLIVTSVHSDSWRTLPLLSEWKELILV